MNEKDELTYGETIKQPFPERDKIDWVMVYAPEWYPDVEVTDLVFNSKYRTLSDGLYITAKQFYENSQDFKVKWQLKQTDQHADIKAEYEKAIADGKIVKVFELKKINQSDYVMNPIYDEVTSPAWNKDDIYKLRYYNIDWNKLLSWSYANGEFVECEVGTGQKKDPLYKAKLIGICGKARYFTNKGTVECYCRLAKGVEIKDEWLKEVK